MAEIHEDDPPRNMSCGSLARPASQAMPPAARLRATSLRRERVRGAQIRLGPPGVRDWGRSP